MINFLHKSYNDASSFNHTIFLKKITSFPFKTLNRIIEWSNSSISENILEEIAISILKKCLFF